MLDGVEDPLPSGESFLEQFVDAGVGFNRFEVALELFNLTGKASAFVALHDAYDLGEALLIPRAPILLCDVAFHPPVVHIEPLGVANAGRRLHVLFAFDEDGLDVALFDTNRDADLVEANAGVAGGMFREEGDEFVAAGDALGNGAPPVVAKLDLALVEPDIVPALFQVGLDAADEFLARVVAVAEEDS